ncbi:MAG: hypothetical protein WBY53_03440 [Acidobacteriaceae bacterium]
MIDVHAPNKPISNAGEFFLHLFTITIGLLIAVGIEAGVERYEHHELAAEARQTMTAEIRDNAHNADDALAAVDQEQKKMAQNVAAIEKVQLKPNDPANDHLNIDIGYRTVDMQDTAWRTAQATGALSYMPYKEAETFSDIYTDEQTFAASERKLAEDEAQMLGTIRQYHLGEGKMSADAANAMARDLGIFQGHLLMLKIATRLVRGEQDAYLQGKKPPSHLSENLNN